MDRNNIDTINRIKSFLNLMDYAISDLECTIMEIAESKDRDQETIGFYALEGIMQNQQSLQEKLKELVGSLYNADGQKHEEK